MKAFSSIVIMVILTTFLLACRSTSAPAEPTLPGLPQEVLPSEGLGGTATPTRLPTKEAALSSEGSISGGEAASSAETTSNDPTAAGNTGTPSDRGENSAGASVEPATITSNADLPASTIFDIPWDDRSLFQPGLISSDQGTLEELAGASVYHIEFSSSDDLSLLSGREEVLYTNLENTSLDEIYFHLYPNLLGGFDTISELTVNGVAVEPTYRINQSAMRVPLPETLQPGQQVVVGMQFTVSVPRTPERNYGIFANVDGILALAHFYPMIAVYDDQGWDIEDPADQGDIVYADTSFYLVRVTAPAEATIVASGLVVEESQTDDQQTLTIAAGPMRDFYLAASDRYNLVSQPVGDTTINSYFLPDQTEGGELVLQYAVDAVESFNARYGIYPFTELDLVPTANLALGIEYPGITAINLQLYDPKGKLGDLPTSVFLESTVAHEVAHQWFYSLVGNDQLDEPWVDESLAQYATWRYQLDVNGEAGARGFEKSLQTRWDAVNDAKIPIGLPVSAYDGREYSAIIYGRGPLFFAALADVMGQETLDEFLRDYALTYRWRIAETDDLKRLAEAHCHCDLTDIFATWVYDQ
jgi:hypothetical protein